MPKTSNNYQLQARNSEKMMRHVRQGLVNSGAKQIGPDCYVVENTTPEQLQKALLAKFGVEVEYDPTPDTSAPEKVSQKELARRALKGLAVSNDAVRAAQASYQCDPEYGLTDADMRLAIMAALREMTKCPRRK